MIGWLARAAAVGLVGWWAREKHRQRRSVMRRDEHRDVRWTGVLALIVAAIATGPVATAERASRIVIESKFELFVGDPVKSSEFYAVLGMEVVHAKASGYTTLESGSTVIALSPVPWWLPVRWLGFLRHPPVGIEIVLYTTQLERSRHSLARAGYSPGEIAVQAWGDRDFRITDPDGYYIRVSEGAAR